MYSMVTVVNNTVLHIKKPLKELILEVFITRTKKKTEKFCNCMVMDVN